MRKVLAFLLILGVSAPAAFAESWQTCPSGTKLRLIGTIVTNSADSSASAKIIDTSGHDVRLIVMRCAGTACTTGLTNTDTVGAAAAADYMIDVGAAANTLVVVDLTQTSGLYFDNGISVSANDSNLSSIAAYECR